MIDAQLKKLQKLYDAHESIIEALNDLEDCDFEEVYVNEQKFNNAYYQTLEKLNEIRDIKEASIIKKPRNASPVDIRALESARKQLDEYKSKQDDKETKPLNLSELQTTIKILEGVRENYCHKFDIVMGSTSDKADQKAYDKAKCDFDFAYTIVISRYLEELKNLSPPTVVPLPAKSSAPSSGDTDMRLPRLGLPTFDGTPTQWPSFRDRFLSTIHNRTRLDKINKFQYLMSCITDKHSPIADLKETEEGYDAAWQAVIDHYEDKRLIIDNHFRALLKVERMKVEDAEQLAQLLDTFSLSISALERMFSKEQLYGAIIAHMAIFRLAKPTALALEIERKTEIPSWVEVHKLLKQRVKILKAISSSPSESPSQRPSTNVKPNEIRHTKSLVLARSTCCPLCNNQHSLYQCSQFIELSIPDRNTKVKEKHLCFNCLGPHQMKDCTSKSTCRKCEKKHHTLLHRISTSTEAPIPSPSEASKALRLAYLNKLQARDANQQAKPTTANVSTLSAEADSFEISHVTCSASTSSESITLLSTAIVHLRDASGEWHQARALLDSGSDANFITKAVAQALRLKQQTVRVQANGLGSKSTIIDRKITATFCSRLRKNEHEAEFLVTPSITGLTPIRPVSMASLGIPHDMILADPTFHKPGKIDLLIGNQLFWKMFSGQKFELESGVSMMQSPLGWVIAGSVTSSHVIQTVQCNLSTLSDLHNTMERFYKLEDYRNDKGFLTDEEQHCEEFFEQTYKPPENINQQWIELAESITQLSNIRIKRHFMIDNPVDIQLHGFSDASYKGYGAVVYIRSTDIYGNIESHIVCAKSRIAPKEIRSTPRLELCGAVVLAHVMKLVEKSLNIPLSRKMCWSDSAIVLHWLKKEPPQLQPFVANRISEIQQMSHDISWRHIPGAQNPADLISRGLTPGEIIKNQLWWHGSEFLVTVEASWPDSIVQFDPETPDFKNEFKKAQALTCTTQPPNDIVQLVHDSSKLTRTSRIVAHMKRFSFNARARATKQEERKGPLTVNEILDAEVTIIRNFQKQSLPNEFKMLSSARFVPRNSQVKNLDPCWDSTNQIIRVGGRLRHAKHLSQDERNQILIPKGHLSLLIARRAHEDNMHPGKQSTLNIIKMRYWPIDALRTVSKVCHSCIRCFHVRPAIANQFMGQLPATRITPASVFDNTGVDYAGPITIKAGYTRASKTMKCYIALFVCLATKAIHLEVVSELSTKAFIAALDRFISRRGKCSTIHSDHGTNFIGARNYFREMTQFLHQSTTDEIIRNHLTKQEIQWKHIPPRNPEAGGLWEAGVKSAKYHLSRVTKNANLHYEELSTLMCQIEAILNSRPITQLSTDPNDPQALTAGHFLIGRPLIAPPQRNVLDVNFNRLQRWDRIIQIKQDFWRRWNQGYLHRLQVRTRNYKDKNPVKVGHMALLHVDNAPPLHWPLGIITDIFPGNDGITRVARIRCSGSTFDRPVNKLAILPTADNNDDN